MKAVEDELFVLRAKSEIHDALMRYCRGCDRRDSELISSAFHDDAINEFHMVTGSFPDADHMKSEYDGTLNPNKDMELAGVRWHFIGNLLIEVEGSIAYSEAYFQGSTYYETFEGKKLLRTRALRYLDRWELRDIGWRIAHRAVVDDWNNLEEIEGNGVARLAAIVGKSHLPMYQTRLMSKQSTEDAVYAFKKLKPGERLMPEVSAADAST